MNLLLLVLFILLLFKFPPGANLEWPVSGGKIVFPLGWCLVASAVVSLLFTLFHK